MPLAIHELRKLFFIHGRIGVLHDLPAFIFEQGLEIIIYGFSGAEDS